METNAVRPVRASAAHSGCERLARFSRHNRCLDRDLLSVGALLADVADTEDRVTGREVTYARADRGNDSRKIAARDVRKARNGRVGAPPYLPVRAVYTRRVHVHQHFAGSGDGVRQVTVLENLGPAMLHEVDCFHSSTALKRFALYT